MHRKNWRLPTNGGVSNPKVCAPAWNTLSKARQLGNVKFMVTHNCPVFYRKGWVTNYTIPGCKKAWTAIGKAGKLRALETLVKTDCAVMHRNKWRLPTNGGVSNRKVCAPAWSNLSKARQLGNVKFMVTHNCPVFSRKGWVK